MWSIFTRSTFRNLKCFSLEKLCALIFMIALAIVFWLRSQLYFSNRVHYRPNDFVGRSRVRTPGLVHDLFDRSRVWTPGHAHDLFLWVQGSIPCPCSMILLWVQGSIPGPDHLFWARSIRGLCHAVSFITLSFDTKKPQSVRVAYR